MVSLKEYAKLHNISYEAVRKQVKRYQAELEPHIKVKNRTSFLDNDAIAFLDARRDGNRANIAKENAEELDSKNQEIMNLKRENKALFIMLNEKSEKIEKLQNKILELQKVKDYLESKKEELRIEQSKRETVEKELRLEKRRTWWQKIREK